MTSRRFTMFKPTPATPAADAFVMMPTSALPASTPEQAAYQKSLYEWAFAEAQAVVRPSLPERDLLGVWN
jgi:hypothetical protein